MNPLKLDAKQIEQMAGRDYVNIIRLFKRYVELECSADKITIVKSYFSEKTTTPDGGEDGFLELHTTGSIKFKKKVNCFQFKSSNFTATSCANEISINDDLKPNVREALEQDGTYFQVISKEFGARNGCTDREEAIFSKAKEYLSSVKRDQIVVLDAEYLATWFSAFFELVVKGYEYLGVSIPGSFQTITSLVTEMQVGHKRYYSNEKIESFISEISNFIDSERKILRIIGQPGIGKTRLIAESLSKLKNSVKGVVYCKLSEPANDVQQYLRSHYLDIDNIVFILDDCSKEFLSKVSTYFLHPNSKIFLIAIDHDVQEYIDVKTRPNLNYLFFDSDDMKDVVQNIINNKYTGLLPMPMINVLVEYADGNPFMAFMLVEEVNLEYPGAFYGRIDEGFKKKLLLGRQGHSDPNRLYDVAKACSIFAYFGFPQVWLESVLNEEEKKLIESQTQILAENICSPPMKIDEFVSEVQFLKKRGLMQTRGKYHFIRPLPLAINLAIDYIDSLTSSKKVIEIVSLIEDTGLTDSFCERFKFLGNSVNAKSIAERICGENSPFGEAEVLNTELGSRLFRSLVEVNPEALIKTLEKLYLNALVPELRKVDLGRRNLIWSLEILCFNKSTFQNAARILYRFAQAENETWSNNSRGVFKQLFRPFLSGTEADFNARLEVLHYSLSLPIVEDNDFLIEAIMASFEIQGASRMGGPEQQGTRVLKDFRPTTKLEVFEYWREIIQLLKIVWDNHPEFRGQIEKQFYLKSLQILSLAEPDMVINFIIWLESNRVIIPTSFYRSLERQLTSPRLPESAKIKIGEFLNSREPQSPKDKFIRQVRDASYSPGNDGNGIDIDETERQVRKLAREFREQGTEITDLIDLMLKGQQNYTEIFIQEYLSFNKQNDQRMRLWDLSVEKLKAIEAKGRNWAVLNGVMRSSPEDEKLNLILSLGEIDEFEEIFLSLVNLHLKSVQELETVWDLIIRKGYCSETISKLRIGHFVLEENFDSTKYICDKLRSLGDIGYWSVLDVLYRRLILKGIEDNAEWAYCKQTFLVYDYFNLENKPKFIDLYSLVEISQRLVKKFTEQEFIDIMTERLLNFLKISHSMHYDDQFSELALQLIEINFKAFWIIFSKALLSSDYFVYSAKNLFGSDHGNTNGGKQGMLFTNPENWDKIIEWCMENSTKGPIFIATLMPIYDSDNNTWHPFANKMINEFGNNPDFLTTMSANMGSFGWVGSPIDYYESEIRLYEQLLGHSILNVKDFARKQIEILKQLIERQKLEEEERFLGL